MYIFKKISATDAENLCRRYSIKFNSILGEDYFEILDNEDNTIGIIAYTSENAVTDIDYFEVIKKRNGIGRATINDFILQQKNNSISKITLTPLDSAKAFWNEVGFSFVADDKMEKCI